MKSKILITGGSGLVGLHLSEKLSNLGYEVVHLSRFKQTPSKFKTFTWDISAGKIEEGAFMDVQHIIHLAGSGVADKKWTPARKKELTSSRVDSANLIMSYLKSGKYPVKSFISASAIGIYGFDTGSIVQTEDRNQLGDDFLATLTKKWEAAADQFKYLNCRIVKLRIGLVLSEKGGLLKKLVPMAKMGLSSAFGNGEQYMSWIHIDDLVNMFVYTVENEKINGVYNAVAPNPVSNKQFLSILSKVINKPYFLPDMPKIVLKIFFGELASVITGGNNVSSAKIEESGYTFQYPELQYALKELHIK